VEQQQSRIVFLKGPSGIGKKTVLKSVIKYAFERSFIRDGAYLIDGSLKI